MKKLYTLALAAAVVFGASAKESSVLSADKGEKYPISINHPAKLALKSELKFNAENSPVLKAKTVRKAVAAEDVYGQYVWNFATFQNQSTLIEYKDQEFFVYPTEEPTVGVVSFLRNQALVVVDLENGVLQYPLYKLGQGTVSGTTVDVYSIPLQVDEELNLSIKESVDLKVVEGGLEMDYYDGLGLGYIPAGTDPSTAQFAVTVACLTNEFKTYVESEYWTTIGEGTFVDGIMYAFFRPDEEGSVEKVPVSQVVVQRSVQDPNYIRAKNAFGAGLAWGFEGGFESEPLYLDITDPACVIAREQFTGLSTQEDGDVYILSKSANYKTIEDFLAAAPEFAITYADNVISFPGNSMYFYFPDVDPEHVYTSKTPFAASLTLPSEWNAIDNITVEGADAPVEYFNLQGVRVANPENGLFIRRCGKNVKKVLVK